MQNLPGRAVWESAGTGVLNGLSRIAVAVKDVVAPTAAFAAERQDWPLPAALLVTAR